MKSFRPVEQIKSHKFLEITKNKQKKKSYTLIESVTFRQCHLFCR